MDLGGFPSSSDGKESVCNTGDPGLIPDSGRSPGEGNGNALPVFLPAESHGQRSPAGYSPWHRKSDMMEQLTVSNFSGFLKLKHSK